MTAQPGEWVSDDVRVSHRVIEEWRGVQVKTLEDLLRPGLRAVCVGINPAPDSVAAGHYYQGKLGQAFFQRASVAPGCSRRRADGRTTRHSMRGLASPTL